MITIRRAEPQDCEAVLCLASAFATSFAVERSAFESSFPILLQEPNSFLVVALDDTKIVGYVLGFDHFTFFANGRVSWVEEIMVAENIRRSGIGRRLVEAFEQWARRRESKLVALATRRAEPFYSSIGYDPSATYLRKLL